ncbi:putative G-protein coupled receptor 174 [Oryzias melastigma]|uniref:Putative G-protein coupled receptor 174 n=1 Tax=Oryzias melastigma TaxID=30732 RepID=A0A834BYE8_ORYME|nr:putative G-protein coupled receptor 174 [Oryzias melastigma]
MKENCTNSSLKDYQHDVYAVVYSVILAPGLIFNILALWVFRIYIKETKKGVLFMMNLALSDLLQVLSLPLRIYYYLYGTWPFGTFLCMACFYVKYVNMYAVHLLPDVHQHSPLPADQIPTDVQLIQEEGRSFHLWTWLVTRLTVLPAFSFVEEFQLKFERWKVFLRAFHE